MALSRTVLIALVGLLALAVLSGCPGAEPEPEPDCVDTDGDAICDDVDICAGFPDQADYDGDGTPDGCDGCPLDASGSDGDADADGVCDATDACAGFNDTFDFDGDGTPDGCDGCPADPNDASDSDEDTVCDYLDVCDGEDDTLDQDGDFVPDGCDPCPQDDPDDTDGDGVCEGVDVCLGDDATGDTDGDGTCDDAEPLAPPSDLDASISGSDVTVTWTNSSSQYFGRTVIVRQYANIVDGVPGAAASVGDAVGTAGEVVYAGSETTFTDAGLDAGAAFYSAWTVNLGGVASTWATRTWSLIDTQGPQSGSVSVDLTSGAVTAASPSHFTVTGAAVYDAGAEELELTLDVISLLARRVFHPKLAVQSLNAGSYDGAGYEGDEVIYYGPEAMLPGVPVTETITITGVDGGTDPLTFDFAIVDHQGALHAEDYGEPSQFTDLGGTGLGVGLDQDVIGFKAGQASMERGFMLEDGSLAYGGARNQPVVAVVDLDTLATTEGLELGGYGSVSCVRESPDQRWIYAVYAASHVYDGGPDDPLMEFVKIEAATLTEVARVELVGDYPDDAIPRNFTLSADGSTAAIVIRDDGRLFIVDTETMTVNDGAPTDDDNDGFDLETLPGVDRDIPNAAALSADGATAYVGYRREGEIDVIDVATWTAATPWGHPTDDTGNTFNTTELFMHGTTLLWISQNGGLVAFDAAGVGTQLIDPSDDMVGAIVGHDGNTLFLREESGSDSLLWGWDLAAGALVDLDNDRTDGTPGPSPAEGDGSHQLVVTPF